MMKSTLTFLRATLLGGVLLLLPFIVLVLVVTTAIDYASMILDPIVQFLPAEWEIGPVTADLVALALILLLCFAAGLLLRAPSVTRLARFAEDLLLKPIPGFAVIRSMFSQHLPEGMTVEVAMARYDLFTELVFVMERNGDGTATVFVPSAPTPLAGFIRIVDESRLVVLNVSVRKAFETISQLGVDMAALLKSAREAQHQAPLPES